jgi:hypothetical protein
MAKEPPMKITGILLVCVVLSALLLGSAHAGIVLVVNTESSASKDSGGTATVYADGSRLRIDSNEGGDDATVIYSMESKDNPIYWIIDNRTRTYFEFTKADMDQRKEQIAQGRKMFQEQLKTLPPEQRAQMEELYKKQMGAVAQAPVETEYKKVATGSKVGKWVCTHYEGYHGGEKSEEVWAANWKDLGVTKKDLSAVAGLADLFEGVGQDMPAFFYFVKDDSNLGVDGFPVMVVSYLAGNRTEKSEIREIRKETLSADLFKLPAGLKKKSMTGPPR